MNMQSRVLPAPVMSERRVSLIGAVLVAIGPMSMALYTPAMPEIVHAFGTTEAAVKLTLSLYFAGFALAALALWGCATTLRLTLPVFSTLP